MKKTQWVVMAILGMGSFAMHILSPILPLYLTYIGISPGIIGLMFSTAMVAMAIGEWYWGWIADRVGFKVPLSTGTIVCGLVVLFFILAESVLLLFIIFFFWGLCRSAIFGPSRGILAVSASPVKKATFLAATLAIISASKSLGALPSGYMVNAWGFSSVFFSSCGISFLAGFMVLLGLKSIEPIKEPQQKGKLYFSRVGLGSLTLQCLVTAFQFFGYGIVIAFLPLLATQVIGASYIEVGILVFVMGVATMLLSIPLGALADRIGNKIIMIFGLLITSAAMVGLSFTDSFASFILIVIVYSIGFSSFSPAALSMISSSTSPNRQSTIMGFYGGICENTGVITGSALGGIVWGVWGPQAAFLMGAVGAILGAIVCIFVKKHSTRSPGPLARPWWCCPTRSAPTWACGTPSCRHCPATGCCATTSAATAARRPPPGPTTWPSSAGTCCGCSTPRVSSGRTSPGCRWAA